MYLESDARLRIFCHVPAAAQPKKWVCGRLLVGIARSNPARGHGCLCVLSVVFCQVDVSATDRSLVQRSPTECNREASTLRKPWLTKGCRTMKEGTQ